MDRLSHPEWSRPSGPVDLPHVDAHQELIDHCAAYWPLVAMITPGEFKYSFFAASGTEAVEGPSSRQMYTGAGFIAAIKAFTASDGSLSCWQGRLPRARRHPLRRPATTCPWRRRCVERQLDACKKVASASLRC